MPRSDPRQRNRNIAHVWADKRVLRALRNSLDLNTTEYKKLRDVYLALCEIDSDFAEQKVDGKLELRGLTKTCSTYSGWDVNAVNSAMQMLRTLGVVEYGHRKDVSGHICGSFLSLILFDDTTLGNSLIREKLNYENAGAIRMTSSIESKEEPKPTAAKSGVDESKHKKTSTNMGQVARRGQAKQKHAYSPKTVERQLAEKLIELIQAWHSDFEHPAEKVQTWCHYFHLLLMHKSQARIENVLVFWQTNDFWRGKGITQSAAPGYLLKNFDRLESEMVSAKKRSARSNPAVPRTGNASDYAGLTKLRI